jgi:hypothetical protein
MVSTRNSFVYAVIVSICCLSLGARAEQKPADKGARPKIDVVFALDTTSSMTDLIQGAKTKVWSIVNQIASGKPTPEIRVGLVAYRDRGDAYITQVTDLTADLDAMYAKLMGFAAEGSYLSIAQSGGVAEVSTPYDNEIAKVDRDMRDTIVFYGRGEEREKAAGAMKVAESTMAKAKAEARAERAVYAAKSGSGPAGAYAGADLVKAVEDRSVSVDKLSDADLPDELKKMPKTERETFLKKKAEKRHALEKKLAELNQQRGAFIADMMKKASNKDSFDTKVIEVVRDAAKKIGVSY